MAQSYPPPSDTSSKVELSISCSNLKNLDYFSKSDPVVFLYIKRQNDWVKLGRTEVIDNDLNPKVYTCLRSLHMCLIATVQDAISTHPFISYAHVRAREKARVPRSSYTAVHRVASWSQGGNMFSWLRPRASIL